MNRKNKLYRTTLFDRFCHAIVVFCFIFTALSGLGFFFPSLNVLTHVLGTPQLARIIHPFLGTIIFCVLMIMLARFAKHNLFNKNDKKWFSSIKHISTGKEQSDLAIGKYNAGQKVLFWLTMIAICLLFISGIVIWNQYFSIYFSIDVRRIFLLMHSIVGVALILLIIAHIYMAFWVKGTINSMTTGYVDKKWAKTHHPLWYKETIEKDHTS